MNRLGHRIALFLRALTHRRQLETGMADEIAFHLEHRTADLIRSGLTPQEAARQARIEFGTTETHRDSIRQTLGLRWFDELAQDLRYAVRILTNSPGFTAIAVASLALAIGANTTIFSVANQMLYARLGVPRAQELRLLTHEDDEHSVIHDTWGSWNINVNGRFISDVFTWPVYQQLRNDGHSLHEVFAFKDFGRVNLTANGSAESVNAELVSGNFYAQMETRPMLGRAILPSDDTPGSAAVAILSHGFWQRAFGGSPSIIGKVVEINTTSFTIIGVNPRGFTGAQSVQKSPELFLPLSMIATLKPSIGKQRLPDSPALAWVSLMGRISPGISNEVAESQLNVAFSAATRATMTFEKDDVVPHLVVEDGSRGLGQATSFYRKPIYVLLTLVGFVLLLACANVANLMLARATARQREMSVRLALGAGRARIFRQLLTESLLLASLGGIGGLLLGYLSRNVLPRLLQDAWQRNDLNIPFDPKVFFFTATVTLLTGILFGLAPAWRASRYDVNTGLKEGAQSASRRRRAWSGKAIVSFQVALSTLLVIGCALFLRTVVKLNSIDPGFNPKDLILFGINPPDARYPGGKSVLLHDWLQQAIAAVPGVDGVSVSDIPFLANNTSTTSVRIEGQAESHGGRMDESHISDVATVGLNFHQLMGIPLLAGRTFTAHDMATSPDVAIVNQSFAHRLFPNTSPIGKRFTNHTDEKGTEWIEIIGVCADTRYADLKKEPRPLFFNTYRQFGTDGKNALGVTYLVRTRLRPESLTAALRYAVSTVDPDLPLTDIRTQQQQIDANMQQERTFATLTAGFGILALALAAVGIYGIMAYTVAQRTNEIGIRLALGAARGHIQAMVLRETGLLAAIGVVAGLAIALSLVHLIKSMLYGIRPTDPVSLACSAALLLFLALLAGWLPAVRASSVEPMEALRHD